MATRARRPEQVIGVVARGPERTGCWPPRLAPLAVNSEVETSCLLNEYRVYNSHAAAPAPTLRCRIFCSSHVRLVHSVGMDGEISFH